MLPSGPRQNFAFLVVFTGVMRHAGMRPESVVAGLICQDLQAQAPRGAKMSVDLAAF